jgi:hypothetical protein
MVNSARTCTSHGALRKGARRYWNSWVIDSLTFGAGRPCPRIAEGLRLFGRRVFAACCQHVPRLGLWVRHNLSRTAVWATQAELPSTASLVQVAVHSTRVHMHAVSLECDTLPLACCAERFHAGFGYCPFAHKSGVVHCSQKCVRKEISPPGYFDVKR